MKVVTLGSIVSVIRARRGYKKFLSEFINECEIVDAIPIDRIKKLRKEIDHSLDYYHVHSRVAPYTAIQDVLERIDKMLREVEK